MENTSHKARVGGSESFTIQHSLEVTKLLHMFRYSIDNTKVKSLSNDTLFKTLRRPGHLRIWHSGANGQSQPGSPWGTDPPICRSHFVVLTLSDSRPENSTVHCLQEEPCSQRRPIPKNQKIIDPPSSNLNQDCAKECWRQALLGTRCDVLRKAD